MSATISAPVMRICTAAYQPGSFGACPLVWAHAEYLKQRRSLHDGGLFDLPPQAVRRYLVEKAVSHRLVWRFNHRIRSLPAGNALRIETPAGTRIHWSADDWNSVQDLSSHDTGLGPHFTDLPSVYPWRVELRNSTGAHWACTLANGSRRKGAEYSWPFTGMEDHEKLSRDKLHDLRDPARRLRREQVPCAITAVRSEAQRGRLRAA